MRNGWQSHSGDFTVEPNSLCRLTAGIGDIAVFVIGAGSRAGACIVRDRFGQEFEVQMDRLTWVDDGLGGDS